jgi:multisubunit Na+/H+ antiporter MnhG subunit
MQLIFIGLVVLVLLIFLTNTKRWKAIGRGVKKSKQDLTEEIHSLEDDR